MTFVARSLYIPCPHCGHRNRPHTSKIETLKLYLTDKMPDCRKCGHPLKKASIDGLPENSVYMIRAKRELEEESKNKV